MSFPSGIYTTLFPAGRGGYCLSISGDIDTAQAEANRYKNKDVDDVKIYRQAHSLET